MEDMDEYMRCLDAIAATNHIEEVEPEPGEVPQAPLSIPEEEKRPEEPAPVAPGLKETIDGEEEQPADNGSEHREEGDLPEEVHRDQPMEPAN